MGAKPKKRRGTGGGRGGKKKRGTPYDRKAERHKAKRWLVRVN